MAIIKNSDGEKSMRRAIVLDLGDLRRQAEELEARGVRAAEGIVEEARRERERLIAGGYEAGLSRGLADGLRRGLEEGRAQGRSEALQATAASLATMESAWRDALTQFEAAREALLDEARSGVIRLAVEIARRVVGRVPEVDPSVVAVQVEEALSLTTAPGRLVVEVAPEDAAAAREALGTLAARMTGSAHWEVVERADLARGSAVARGAGGEGDASSGTKLERIVDALTMVGGRGVGDRLGGGDVGGAGVRGERGEA